MSLGSRPLFISSLTAYFLAVLILAPSPANAGAFPFEPLSRAGVEDGGKRRGAEPERARRASIALTDMRALDETPELRLAPIKRVTNLWDRLKQIISLREQLASLRIHGAARHASLELKPLTLLGEAFYRLFIRRDTYRKRHYAAPEVHALMRRASELMAERLPGVRIMIGDIAQAGGGQVPYGARIELLHDGVLRTPLSDLLASVRVRFGQLVHTEVVDPHTTFLSEQIRFADFVDPLLVEKVVTAATVDADGRRLARVETRRFWLDSPLEGAEAKRWWRQISIIVRKQRPVEQLRAEGATMWRTRYIHRGRLIDIDSIRRPRRGLKMEDVTEVRISRVHYKKPGVRTREKRFHPVSTVSGEPRLVAWTQLYEASHLSHMNGLDVDLGYVVHDPVYHFSRDVSQIDAVATRTWVETLYDAGEDVGVGIEQIFMDKRVLRRLLRAATGNRHPVWDAVQLARGHDSHMHVRVRPGFPNVAGSD